MKWETVKKYVANGLAQTIIECRDWQIMTTILIDKLGDSQPAIARTACPVYAAKAREVIMAWDIRCAERLRELFPGYFPPSLRGPKRLIAEYDEAGDWVLNVVSQVAVG